jgi:hypothetical protein
MSDAIMSPGEIKFRAYWYDQTEAVLTRDWACLSASGRERWERIATTEQLSRESSKQRSLGQIAHDTYFRSTANDAGSWSDLSKKAQAPWERVADILNRTVRHLVAKEAGALLAAALPGDK